MRAAIAAIAAAAVVAIAGCAGPTKPGTVKIKLDPYGSTYARYPGAVTAIQRFSGSLGLNVHFHSLFVDGVFLEQADGTARIKAFAFVTECHGEPPYELRFCGYYDDHAVKGADGKWRFRERVVRLWDGAVLERFPGHGNWVPRKRPDSLVIRR